MRYDSLLTASSWPQGHANHHVDLEKGDPDFEIKMANVLRVYKEVEIVNEYRRAWPAGNWAS
jgi:hypothetical protein